MSSIYVHFPWCLAKCPYCDFVSYATERDGIDHRAYADAVIREAEARAAASPDLTIASIFFGGGTPSLWAPEELGRVLARLRAVFTTTADLEITVECNPTSLDRDRAIALRDAGVNRLSIGTQSLRAEQLKFLGRLHDPDGARRAIEGALASGIERVSTDLIFGLPDQSVDDAREQAETLAATGLRHLSCYQLTIEPGTQFGERRKRGLLPMADDGIVADAFLAIEKALEARGLRHYEISNYAAPGHEARHNLAYWHGDEYVGLGCAAYGRIGSVRYRNELDPNAYVTRRTSPTIFTEDLDALALLRERIMLGLRLDDGLDLSRAGRELGIDPWTRERVKAIDDAIARGRLERHGDVIRIPRAAWLFTDDIASRLF
ncbi:MAG: radical SAM family heme chaperone HemW [Deltaproteobacteria bacterium]|nr:radical SAM family heme chaperone HemW [Deltaproteobacteria bacterium]